MLSLSELAVESVSYSALAKYSGPEQYTSIKVLPDSLTAFSFDLQPLMINKDTIAVSIKMLFVT